MAEGRNNSRSSSKTHKTIRDISKMVTSEREELFKIIRGVLQMGYLSSFMDSKVPEKEKNLLHFFTLKRSDPNLLIMAIRDDYIKVYDDIKIAMRKFRIGRNHEFKGIERLANKLHKKLSETARNAMSGLESTDSRTLMRVHRNFLAKYHELETPIRSKALRQKQKELGKAWQEAVKTAEGLAKIIRELRAEMEMKPEPLPALTDESDDDWTD